LPTVAELKTDIAVRVGNRIVVANTAGPKLAGKVGVVVARGTTKSQFRVLLDGSKRAITLHARFLVKKSE